MLTNFVIRFGVCTGNLNGNVNAYRVMNGVTREDGMRNEQVRCGQIKERE